MKMLNKLLLLVVIAILFAGCNKDDYGKERDELLENVEFTKQEMLTGFSIWGKTWLMESVEYEGVEYSPDMSLYHNHGFDGRVNIPLETTTYYNGTDSVEVDSLCYKIGGGGVYFYDNNISISIDLLLMQLQYFSYEEEPYYDILDAYPDLSGTWSFDENTNELVMYEPTTGHFGIFESDRHSYFSEKPDTTYANITIRILELSKGKLKFQWHDPAMDIDYVVNMNELQPGE